MLPFPVISGSGQASGAGHGLAAARGCGAGSRARGGVLGEHLGDGVVVAGQMVRAHADLAGTVSPSATADADAVADIRSRPKALPAIIRELRSLGYVSEPGTGRFIRHAEPLDLKVDVLIRGGFVRESELSPTPIRAHSGGDTVNLPENSRTCAVVDGSAGGVRQVGVLSASVAVNGCWGMLTRLPGMVRWPSGSAGGRTNTRADPPHLSHGEDN